MHFDIDSEVIVGNIFVTVLGLGLLWVLARRKYSTNANIDLLMSLIRTGWVFGILPKLNGETKCVRFCGVLVVGSTFYVLEY